MHSGGDLARLPDLSRAYVVGARLHPLVIEELELPRRSPLTPRWAATSSRVDDGSSLQLWDDEAKRRMRS